MRAESGMRQDEQNGFKQEERNANKGGTKEESEIQCSSDQESRKR